VPAVTSSGPPVLTSHYLTLQNFHRDVFSEFTLDTQATVPEFDLKTWGFLLYPDHSGDHSPDFNILVWQILKDGILPLAQHYFQGYFYPRGPAHQAYCRRFLDFSKVQLQDFASSWRLTERLIGIRVDGMRVEVLFYPVGRFPWQWEAVELSNIDVCPMYGPFEPRRNGPTAECFETLNRIQYVWMPHSNGMYSPVDTPEPSLSDLFGTTSDSSMASVVEGVARACTDDDSIETEMGSVHLGSDGTVTSMCVGPDGAIKSISRIFSSYTDSLTVLGKNRFWSGTGECGMVYTPTSSANGLGFSPASTESLDVMGVLC
jgi:hypothetical protein